MVLLNGCGGGVVLVEDHSKEWVARPLLELKQEMSRPDSYASKIGWKETTYPLASGNYVYVQPLREGCFFHWEVNPNGIIVGYVAKGKECDQSSDTDERLSRQKTRQDY